MAADLLKLNLMHARAAYLHAVRALPSPEDLQHGTIRQHGLEFSSPEQINSQLIELGWAFFTRYEGCLEKWLKDQNVKLNRKCTLMDWLKSHRVEIPESYSVGLGVYRTIRNTLHHDDGASFDGTLNTEVHLMPEHMENFFDLFCWIGAQVETVASSNNT